MLILIRGVPGSGKSTFAQTNFDFPLVEADMYFIRPDGKYDFNPRLLKEAHEWCFEEARSVLLTNGRVVVANTFTRKWEMQRYLDMADNLDYDVSVVRCTGAWNNVHGVPADKVKAMLDRFEDYEGERYV